MRQLTVLERYPGEWVKLTIYDTTLEIIMNSYDKNKVEVRAYPTQREATKEYLKAGFWLAEHGFAVVGEVIES